MNSKTMTLSQVRSLLPPEAQGRTFPAICLIMTNSRVATWDLADTAQCQRLADSVELFYTMERMTGACVASRAVVGGFQNDHIHALQEAILKSLDEYESLREQSEKSSAEYEVPRKSPCPTEVARQLRQLSCPPEVARQLSCSPEVARQLCATLSGKMQAAQKRIDDLRDCLTIMIKITQP